MNGQNECEKTGHTEAWREAMSRGDETPVQCLDCEAVTAKLAIGAFGMDDNPYLEEHIDREAQMNPYISRKAARAIVTMEFVNGRGDRPRRCPCGELLWKKATVLSMFCRNGHAALGGGRMYGELWEKFQADQ